MEPCTLWIWAVGFCARFGRSFSGNHLDSLPPPPLSGQFDLSKKKKKKKKEKKADDETAADETAADEPVAAAAEEKPEAGGDAEADAEVRSISIYLYIIIITLHPLCVRYPHDVYIPCVCPFQLDLSKKKKKKKKEKKLDEGIQFLHPFRITMHTPLTFPPCICLDMRRISDALDSVPEEAAGDRPAWAGSDRDYDYTEVH